MKVLELKYKIIKIEVQWMNSREEWREQRKESMSLKIKQQKLATLSNREKIGRSIKEQNPI